MAYLAPSILAADFTRLGEQVSEAERAGAEYLHLDVMDGAFVPSISFGMPVIKSLRPKSDMIFDVHLMIEEPGRFLEEFKECGADILTVHAESDKHLHRTVARIRELGMKAGIALNPATPVEELRYILPEVDMVLIMSVNPGFGGQKFLELSIDKIRRVKELSAELSCDPLIEVDGGINLNTAVPVLEAGADILVAGTAVFGGDITQNVNAFKGVFLHGSSKPQDR